MSIFIDGLHQHTVLHVTEQLGKPNW